MQKECPCCSGKPYRDCCGKFHAGELPSTALELMRSRYSAYALGLADYLIQTTHPDNPSFPRDKKGLIAYCKSVKFKKLEILDFKDGSKEAFVSFIAHLSQGNKDLSFTERSRFLKVDHRWLYRDGEVANIR